MFDATFKKKTPSVVEDEGYNVAMLGLDRNNPYPANSIEYKHWEWGYNDAQRDLDEKAEAYWNSNTISIY